jgi:energy-coupling factor transport system ATP-binding protein
MSLIVSGLGYTYHRGTPLETTALQDISFQAEPGQWISIVGHTGSGKSTLAQHLNGLLLPQRGSVSVDGIPCVRKEKRLRDVRRIVGLIFQYPEQQLFAETVFDEISYAPRNWSCPEKEIPGRVARAAGRLGIPEDSFSRSPFLFSGGEKRKIAIASVLSASPRYLVLDEPTAGLDAGSRRELLSLLTELRADEGICVILITHDLEIALEMSTRILMLDEGRHVFWGSPERLAPELVAGRFPRLVPPDVLLFSSRIAAQRCDVPITWDWKVLAKALERSAISIERKCEVPSCVS